MNKIRTFRKKKNLTLKQLGAIIGVSESTLSKYETGTNEPDLRTLSMIADVLDTSVDALLGRDEPDAPVNLTKEQHEKAQTVEAKIISAGIDKMPEPDRERALSMMRLMFAEYADFFRGE